MSSKPVRGRTVAFITLATACSLDDFVGARPASDAGLAEVGATDPGIDPRSDAGEAGVGACAHTFCDDFDHGPLGERWDAPPLPTSGLLLDSKASVSPPSSLLVHCGTGRSCNMTKTFPGASHVRMDLDVQLVTAPETALTLSRLRPATGEFNVSVEFESKTNALMLTICNASGCPTTETIGSVGTAGFRHVSVEVDLRGGVVTVTLDDVTVLNDAGPVPIQNADGVVAVLGDPITSSGASTEFRFDNFSLDVL